MVSKLWKQTTEQVCIFCIHAPSPLWHLPLYPSMFSLLERRLLPHPIRPLHLLHHVLLLPLHALYLLFLLARLFSPQKQDQIHSINNMLEMCGSLSSETGPLGEVAAPCLGSPHLRTQGAHWTGATQVCASASRTSLSLFSSPPGLSLCILYVYSETTACGKKPHPLARVWREGVGVVIQETFRKIC